VSPAAAAISVSTTGKGRPDRAGRGTGTDADAIHLSRAGIPTGLVSVPLRYMHSPVELAMLSDMDAAARLIAAFAQLLEPGFSFER